LNKFEINKEVNKLVKTIKKSSNLQSIYVAAKLNETLEAVKAEESVNNPSLQIKSQKSAGTFNDKESESLLNNDLNKLNSNSELNFEQNNSGLCNNHSEEVNCLEKVFEGKLGDTIIFAIQSSSFTEKIFKLLTSLNFKDRSNQQGEAKQRSSIVNNNSNCYVSSEEANFNNEDVEILQNSFEIFCSLISLNDNNNDNNNNNNNLNNNFQRILISDETQRKKFSQLCLFNLISKNESIRESSALALIRLSKIQSIKSQFDISAIIFNEIFSFLLALDNNNKSNDNLNLYNLFEFFSFIFEIYFSNKQSFAKSLQKINSSVKVSVEDFIFEIAQSIENDIKSTKPELQLRNEIFIGYIKILSKVVENNNEIKEEISERFNLIQEIMTKILFKQSDKTEFSHYVRKSSSINNNNSFRNNNDCIENNSNECYEFVNPESFCDLKLSRRKSLVFRNACYKFILSMLKNSIKNFEKFFAINILEDESKSAAETNNANLTKKFSFNSNNNNNKNNNNDSELNSSTNNFSRQNSNNNNTNKKILNQKIYSNYRNNNTTKAFDHVGLRNLGCICYMNSMLQQFYMVPSFRKALLQTDDNLPPDSNNPQQSDDNVFHQVQRMFAYLSLSNREEYNPEAFCFSFKDYEGNPTNTSIQQDAQEFLSRFLDKIESSLKPTQYKYLVHSVFGGKICSQLCCENCQTTKKRFEDMFFLSLSVSNMKSIYESLDKFISVEKIDEYNCDTCAKKVTIAKRNLLAELPNVLIIHLQRIYYNYETDRNEKINSRLEFPKVLNLKDYTLEEIEKQNYLRKNNIKESEIENHSNNNINNGNESDNNGENKFPFESEDVYFKNDEYYEYHLVGVNVHIGSADAGHYFSYINKLRNGEGSGMSYDPQVQDEKELWLKFNDTTISKFK